MGQNNTTGRHVKPVEKTKKKTGKIVLFIILGLVVVLAVAGILIFRHMYGLMNTSGTYTTAITDTADTDAPEATPEPFEEEIIEETPTPTPRPLTEEEKAELEEIELRSSLQESAEEIMYNENVYNILLLGADGYSTADNLERSDAMILLSINKETKQIWLTSMMRDTEVWIPGWGTGHLNWATSYQDVNLLIDTLECEQNFAIHIDNWACVNFLSFAEIAGELGPITVKVSAAEAKEMNGLIRQACQMYDKVHEGKKKGSTVRSYFPRKTDGMELDENGRYTITIDDGFQILGYCRERHINGDTGRSAHQRDALMQMWENVKKMSLKEKYELAEKVMSIISTDMTPGQCASMLLQSPNFLTYEINAQQCPVIGAFWKGRDANGLSIYNADFPINRNFLRATIYGEKLTEGELTSWWTGSPVLVYSPEDKQ